MKDKECIYCEKFFECKGKDTKNPCVNFEDRRKKGNHGEDK
jgi:hypothetical protein